MLTSDNNPTPSATTVSTPAATIVVDLSRLEETTASQTSLQAKSNSYSRHPLPDSEEATGDIDETHYRRGGTQTIITSK